MARVCPWQHVRTFDNFLRFFIHNPEKMYAPYVEPGMKAMDMGCGAGFASLGLAKMVGETGKVFAVDLQPEMLEMVKARAEKAGISDRIVTHQCSQDDIGLTDSFDFVNAFYMVHELPDTERFFSQVRSLLSPDGKFFIAEPIFHVSSKQFTKMLGIADSAGLKEHDRPKIRFSKAVVLAKD